MALTSLSVTAFADETERIETYSWQFGVSTGEIDYNIEGSKSWIYKESDDSIGYASIYVDAESGKFSNDGRTDQYCQINSGTILYLPAEQGTTITIDTYSNEKYSIGTGTRVISGDGSYIVRPDDLVEVSAFDSTATSSTSYVKVTANSTGYIVGITADNNNSYVAKDKDTMYTLTGSITAEDDAEPDFASAAMTFYDPYYGDSYKAAINSSERTYTVSIPAGDYETTVSNVSGYETSDRVTVTTETEQTNEVYLESTASASALTSYSITVGTSSSDYSTFAKAMEAVRATRDSGVTDTITIELEDNIEEQVLIDEDNITLEGGGYTISWYYCPIYKYYSVDENGYYSEALFRDQYEKTTANTSFWGGVVIVTGDYFKAENVTFKNTYNYKVTDKEKADGVEKDTTASTTQASLSETRQEEGFDPTDTAQQERANALAINGNYAEFYKCSILSSQDTLGYNSDLSGIYTYFNNCTIGGNVDYICGAGTMLF